MTFSGHLEERIGVRFTVGLGCCIMVLGVLLTALAIQISVVLTAITYGCFFGLGTALAYAPPLGVAMKWFPKSKGLVNGIIGRTYVSFLNLIKVENQYL
jgi:MFS family permease